MSTHGKFSKFQAEVICELHPLFAGLMWVASARSTDETRAVLTLIHVEREGLLWKIVATDGRRMHVHTFDPGLFDSDIETLDEGLYEVVAKSTRLIVIAEAALTAKYPDWRRVLPGHEPQHSAGVDARTTGQLGVSTGVLLATDFTSDAIGFGHGRKKDARVVVEYGPSPEPGGGFLIRHDLGEAVIMPMRQDEDDAPERPEKCSTPDIPGMEPIEDGADDLTGEEE